MCKKKKLNSLDEILQIIPSFFNEGFMLKGLQINITINFYNKFTTGCGTVYRKILIDAKLKTGKRGQKQS